MVNDYKEKYLEIPIISSFFVNSEHLFSLSWSKYESIRIKISIIFLFSLIFKPFSIALIVKNSQRFKWLLRALQDR